jgi:hypothetical protein
LHRLASNFVLGYHGCDRDVGEALLAGKTKFKFSNNDWDWLGEGIYFWESNPKRGLEFAKVLQRWRAEHDKANQITEPFVIGAAIDLGFCLDLTTSTGIQAIAGMYADLAERSKTARTPMPKNEGGSDLLFRRLDCAVINHLHAIRERQKLQRFDTVKGVFIEGNTIYAGSGFYERTHVQIAVRNPECIKGIFRVPPDQLAAP